MCVCGSCGRYEASGLEAMYIGRIREIRDWRERVGSPALKAFFVVGLGTLFQGGLSPGHEPPKQAAEALDPHSLHHKPKTPNPRPQTPNTTTYTPPPKKTRPKILGCECSGVRRAACSWFSGMTRSMRKRLRHNTPEGSLEESRFRV